jgi:cyclophilin family peptidyl-prolyl cis-trans isomerase
MNLIIPVMLALVSVLAPAKEWFAPSQPVNIVINAEGNQPLHLILTSFSGQTMDAIKSTEVSPAQEVDIKEIFPAVMTPGTYILYVVPKDADVTEYLATPLVVESRQDRRRAPDSGPVAIRIVPLSYGVLHTDHGEIKVKFYFDVAPNTVENFIDLAKGGFYDGLTFYRIAPQFVIQAGDPLGNGVGGPGYRIDAEFSDRPHHEGVLSMARELDPNEAPGVLPGPVAANSAGSQFFICLDYARTEQLNGRYTAFAEVIEGVDVVRKIGALPLIHGSADRPETPPVIEKIEIKTIEPGHNPYQPKPDVLIPQSPPIPTTQP